MADLSKLSDADLEALSSGNMAKMSDEGLNHIASQQSASPSMAPAPQEHSANEAFAGGTAQGMTLGHSPQIVGAGATLAGKLQDLIQGPVVDPKTGQAIPRVNYVDARDATSKSIDQAANDHPMANFAGNIAGSMATGRAAGALASKAIAPAATAMGRIGQGAAMGGAQAAMYNPGDKEGVVNPAQLGERASNIPVGAAMGGALSGIGELIKKGAGAANDVRMIKSGEASDVAKREIDNALQSIDQKQIKPRSDQLRALIQGKQFEINPDRVESTFPRLAKSMSNNLDEGETRRALSGDQALRLKRAADSAANYGASKPFDPTATAKGEDAKSLADILRTQLNSDPKVAQVNSEMADILAKKNALADRARSAPISAIRAEPGTDKDSLVKSIDKLAGSNLEGLDNRIGNAKDLLLQPSNFFKPLNILNETKKTAIRGASELSRGLDKAPQGTKEALLNAILEQKRRAK